MDSNEVKPYGVYTPTVLNQRSSKNNFSWPNNYTNTYYDYVQFLTLEEAESYAEKQTKSRQTCYILKAIRKYSSSANISVLNLEDGK